MPNWCSNGLTISHTNDTTWKWFMETQFDFEKINPLIKITEDNYCEMFNKYKDKLSFLSIINNVGYQPVEFEDYCQEEFDAESPEDRTKLCENLEWDLRVSVCWGTKWKVDMDENDFLSGLWDESKNELGLSFQTAWCPPKAIYEKLDKMGFKLSANFMETGCDFVGSYCNKDGELKVQSYSYNDIQEAFKKYWFFHKDEHGFHDQFFKDAVDDEIVNESCVDMLECELEMWEEEFEQYIKYKFEPTLTEEAGSEVGDSCWELFDSLEDAKKKLEEYSTSTVYKKIEISEVFVWDNGSGNEEIIWENENGEIWESPEPCDRCPCKDIDWCNSNGCVPQEEEKEEVTKYCFWDGFTLLNLPSALPKYAGELLWVVDNVKEKGWAGEGSIKQITYKAVDNSKPFFKDLNVYKVAKAECPDINYFTTVQEAKDFCDKHDDLDYGYIMLCDIYKNEIGDWGDYMEEDEKEEVEEEDWKDFYPYWEIQIDEDFLDDYFESREEAVKYLKKHYQEEIKDEDIEINLYYHKSRINGDCFTYEEEEEEEVEEEE